MTLVTAIRSFFTPTKVYNAGRVKAYRELRPDGSTLICSFKDGKPFREVLREPIDVLQYNPQKGNVLTVGHVTTVKDLVAGTKTVVNKIEKKFERPVYNALNPKEKLVEAGGSLHYFHKTKTKNDILVDTFSMNTRKDVKSCVQFKYDEFGNSKSVKMYKVEPKEVK